MPVTSCFHGHHFLVRSGSPASREGKVPGAEPLPDEKVAHTRPGTLMLTPLAGDRLGGKDAEKGEGREGD